MRDGKRDRERLQRRDKERDNEERMQRRKDTRKGLRFKENQGGRRKAWQSVLLPLEETKSKERE